MNCCPVHLSWDCIVPTSRASHARHFQRHCWCSTQRTGRTWTLQPLPARRCKHKAQVDLSCCGLFVPEERAHAVSRAGRCAAREASQVLWNGTFTGGQNTLIPWNQVTAPLAGQPLLRTAPGSGFEARGFRKARAGEARHILSQSRAYPHRQRTASQKGGRQATHSRFEEPGSPQGQTLFGFYLPFTMF